MFGLTAREIDVLRLLSNGLSDREIRELHERGVVESAPREG